MPRQDPWPRQPYGPHGAHDAADVDPRSIMQVEAEIRRLSEEMNRHTNALIHVSQDWAEAKHRHEVEEAQEYLRVKRLLAAEPDRTKEPTIPEIEAHVRLGTEDTYAALLRAEALMKASRTVCQALIAQLDALRSINANARAAADFTRGEGA